MDAERTEQIQKKCLSGGESRLGSNEGRCGRCNEHMKRMSNVHLPEE